MVKPNLFTNLICLDLEYCSDIFLIILLYFCEVMNDVIYEQISAIFCLFLQEIPDTFFLSLRCGL